MRIYDAVYYNRFDKSVYSIFEVIEFTMSYQDLPVSEGLNLIEPKDVQLGAKRILLHKLHPINDSCVHLVKLSFIGRKATDHAIYLQIFKYPLIFHKVGE
jgi:hypothetical protein